MSERKVPFFYGVPLAASCLLCLLGAGAALNAKELEYAAGFGVGALVMGLLTWQFFRLRG